MPMTALLDILKHFTFLSVVCRLVIAMAVGFCLGYGRSRKQQSAGLRTYMLVSIGAALTMIISMYEHEMLYGCWAFASAFSDIKFDAVRFSASVLTGIGFLAAGTIISIAHRQISGLTTAIGLFSCACLGIASGAGFYEVVLIAIVLIILTLEVLKPLEILFKRKMRNITIYVEFTAISTVEALTKFIEAQHAEIHELDIENYEDDGKNHPSAILSLKLGDENPSHSSMLSSIAELDYVYSVQELIS